jgi:hypothetical protein
LLCLWWLAVISCGRVQSDYQPGVHYFGRNHYIEYIAGDLPVIFSAPHGGALAPSEIPTRADDGSGPHFATVTDSNTEELALAVQTVFCDYFGHRPHVVICHLKRSKLDCNRSLAQSGAGDNVQAVRAWHEFQDFINIASNSAVAQNGLGFYIDLHGQKHVRQRLELGYLLTAGQLAKTDTELNQPAYAKLSSIRSLAALADKKGSLPFSELLRGRHSFGGLMASYGYPSVPSPDMPAPGESEPYFDGGYNVAAHTSRSGGGPVDGLQIEANMTGVRDSPLHRTNCAIALARTLDYFFTNYYGLDLRLSAPCIWRGGAGTWAAAANWGGLRPVAGNYLLFDGPGGAVRNDLAALTSGSGRIHSILFGTGATGSYHLEGNPISLNAGVTNLSSRSHAIDNAITLLSAQSFSAAPAPLVFTGNITSTGFDLSVEGEAGVAINGLISGAVRVQKGGTLGGAGMIGGPVSVAGTIAPGHPSGALTITHGLSLEDGGAYNWTLAANSDAAAGTNFSQIILSGGNLALGAHATLRITFTNFATAPALGTPFWQVRHSWKIISLGPTATNIGPATFESIANAAWPSGKFVSLFDTRGDVLLNYIPGKG